MRAYKTHYSNRNTLGIPDLGYRYNLPQVNCTACGQTWGEMVEYPAFRFDFLNHKEFNFDRVLSLSEFEKIRNRIVRAAARKVMVVPGGEIGELSGRSQVSELDDFTWGRVTVPQISKRARDLLANEGIILPTAEMQIRLGRRRIDTHLALQVELAVLLTEESLKRNAIFHCPTCGIFDPVYPRPKLLPEYEFSRCAWPEGQHLVMVLETLDVLVSEQFMEAVKRHKLTGMAFVECGHFV